MGNQEEKKANLLREIKRSLLISDEDKKFWLEQVAQGLPEEIINKLSEVIINGNEEVNSYIDAAIGSNPENHYLNEIKSKVSLIKKKAFALDESSQKQNLEENLKQQLEDV